MKFEPCPDPSQFFLPQRRLPSDKLSHKFSQRSHLQHFHLNAKPLEVKDWTWACRDYTTWRFELRGGTSSSPSWSSPGSRPWTKIMKEQRKLNVSVKSTRSLILDCTGQLKIVIKPRKSSLHNTYNNSGFNKSRGVRPEAWGSEESSPLKKSRRPRPAYQDVGAPSQYSRPN